MIPDRNRDAEIIGPDPVAVRCRACGRRVARADPGCPIHGPVPAPEGADRQAIHVDRLLRPSFPGYRVVRLIGRGGFGAVYEAEPAPGGVPVAIKLARSDREDAGLRLEDEQRALRSIGPPHVPAVLDTGRLEDGSPYLVMEHVDAPTLADRMVVWSGPMPLGEIGPLADAALVALQAVHERGYIHRDLKPENIFIDGAHQAKIIDFGLASPPAAEAPSPARTAEGEAPGTAEYMAPEQCEGHAAVDARADVYAMGVILYELLAGRPPFWGPRAAVVQSHRAQRPPRLSAIVPISAAVEEIVLRCLAKDPDDRFKGARALREALAQAFEEPPSAELSTGSMPRSSEPPQSTQRLTPVAEEPGGRERRRVGLVYFRTEADVIAVQRRLLSLGGQLGYAAGDRFVAVYSHEVGDNPARRALRAARELVKRGVCERALIDLAPVTVQTRADGARRFFSPLFARDDRFPGPSDPAGVFALPSAASTLSELGTAPVEDARAWVRAEAVRPGIRAETSAADLRTRPLVGRDAVLEALLAGARGVVESSVPAIASVIAEAGHGKTHLGQVLIERLERLDLRAEVIDLRALPPDAGDADRTLRELLRQAIGVPAAAPPDAGRAILEERLGAPQSAELGSILAFALGWLPAEAPALRALRAAPGALRSAMITAAGKALARRAGSGPLFVVLDDAHHADEATLGALEYAALVESGAAIWACALGRPAFADLRPSWGERAGSRQRHRLGPLDPASARELFRRLLLPAESVPEKAIDHLLARTEGVPLLMVELTRGLKRAGVIRRKPRSESWFLATDELDNLPELPVTEWLSQAEMDTLSPSLRAHARLVALLGGDVMAAEIDGVLRRLDPHGGTVDFPLDARVGTRRLLTAGLLVQHREGRIGFRHGLARESIAASAAPALTKRIHRAAADYYADAKAIPEDRRLRALAYHAAAAGLGAIAEAAHMELGDAARARHAYVEAERLYSRAIETAPAPRLTAYRGRGLMRYRLGRHDEALVDFERARELAVAARDVAVEVEILLDEATARDWRDDYQRSQSCVLQAEVLALGASTPAIEAGLLLGLGRSAHRFSREDEATALLERAVVAADALGDEGYETRVIALLLLGFIYPALGRLADAGRALDRAIALCEEHGDTLHLGTAINNRGMLRSFLGDKAGMIADFSRVLSLARELGHDILEIVGHYNLAEFLYLMDDLDAAEPHARRALTLEERSQGGAARPVVALLGARIALYKGDEAGARAAAEAIRKSATEHDAAGGLAVPSEEVLCTMLELSTSSAPDAEWDALEERSARFSVGQEHVEVLEARALALLRRGRRPEAAAQLEKALAAAARIPNVMGDRLRRALAWMAQAS